MPGFERAATIDRPPSQVYAVLDDIHAARHWMPAIRRIEVLTPNDAVDVGFRWRETRKVMGIFRMSAELEVVEHEPPHLWGLMYEDKKLRARATFQLVRNDSGTLITMRQEVEDLQGKPKRAERMSKWIEKSDDDLLLRLKAFVESQPVREEPPEPVHEPEESQGVEPAVRKPRKSTAKKTATKTGKKTGKKATKTPKDPAKAPAKRPRKKSSTAEAVAGEAPLAVAPAQALQTSGATETPTAQDA